MIENKEEQDQYVITQLKDVLKRKIRSPFFQYVEEIGDAFEIRTKRSKLLVNTPVHCGYAVYELAKLRMLEFVRLPILLF